MRTVIVDTNVIFSALLSRSSAIRGIIIGSKEYKFFASDYTHIELKNHCGKLKKASKLTDEEMDISQHELFKYITFITLDMIPERYWLESERIVADIDMDDMPFVALALYLDAYLWTGDKILYNGLRSKGFEKIISTSELKLFLGE